MKPWLFDILACPIDKFFPLKLYIFSFETKPDEFQSILNIYRERDLDLIKSQKILEISKLNGKLYIKDNIIIEKNTAKTYFKLIISSIDELTNIIVKSPYDIAQKCFFIILTEIKDKISGFSKDIDLEKIEELLPELYFVNKIKIDTEIESGLLFCEKCNRWFPIIETVPQMLPDEYRDKEKDIQFLKTIKNLLDDEFLKQDLKPFNI
ncbi:MAG: Trm112 family protein [Candidatus Thorarchaeota archaeon]